MSQNIIINIQEFARPVPVNPPSVNKNEPASTEMK